MAASRTAPVQDSVAKINNEIAVGEDLEFERKWWRFENIVWTVFALIVLLDLLGAFGRGPLAKAHVRTADGAIRMNYERIERFSTPSILTLHFSPAAVHNGVITLWVGDSVIKALGNRRVIPEPQTSTISAGGVLYTFSSSSNPDSVEFALEPTAPGIYRVQLRLPGQDELQARILVMP